MFVLKSDLANLRATSHTTSSLKIFIGEPYRRRCGLAAFKVLIKVALGPDYVAQALVTVNFDHISSYREAVLQKVF